MALLFNFNPSQPGFPDLDFPQATVRVYASIFFQPGPDAHAIALPKPP